MCVFNVRVPECVQFAEKLILCNARTHAHGLWIACSTRLLLAASMLWYLIAILAHAQAEPDPRPRGQSEEHTYCTTFTSTRRACTSRGLSGLNRTRSRLRSRDIFDIAPLPLIIVFNTNVRALSPLTGRLEKKAPPPQHCCHSGRRPVRVRRLPPDSALGDTLCPSPPWRQQR